MPRERERPSNKTFLPASEIADYFAFSGIKKVDSPFEQKRVIFAMGEHEEVTQSIFDKHFFI